MHARPHLARWEHKRPMGPRGPRGNGDISEERFILLNSRRTVATLQF